MATANTNSEVFLPMAKSSQERLGQTDFKYPLNYIFKVSQTDPIINETVLIYDRKISIQVGTLHHGLQLHLGVLISQESGYRLSATAIDNDRIAFKSIASIALSNKGTIKQTNPRHLNTIILKIED